MTSVTTLYIATVNSAATTAHDCRESALRLSAIAGGAARGGSWTPLDVRGQLGFNSSSRRNQHPSFALFEQMRRFRHLAVFKNGRHLAGDACPPHPISMLCSCCRQVSPSHNWYWHATVKLRHAGVILRCQAHFKRPLEMQQFSEGQSYISSAFLGQVGRKARRGGEYDTESAG